MDSSRVDAGLFGTYCAFGALVFVGAKLGMPDVPPLAFAALRLDVAAVVLLAVVGFSGASWRPRTRRDLAAVAFTGVFTLGVMNALLFTGQQYVTAGVGAVVYSLMPVTMTGFAVLLLPETSLDATGALGIALGVLGVWFVASPDPADFLTVRLFGIVVMLASVVVFALGSVVTRRVDPGVSRVTLTAWGALLGGVVNHGIALASGVGLHEVEWSSRAVLALAVVGVLATAVLYAVHFELVSRIGPARTSLNFYAQPLVAAVLGWLAFGNQVGVGAVAGFCCIAGGFALLERDRLPVPGT